MKRIKICLIALCVSAGLWGCEDWVAENVVFNPKPTQTVWTETSEVTVPTEKERKELDASVSENREDELVFSASMEDFIESYNSIYPGESYLTPASQWRSMTYDAAVHSKHETILYTFSEDERMWSLPTLTVYVPSNGNYIQQVTVNFDEHSRTEPLYQQYEEMCFYTLKSFFPNLDDEKITALYTELNQQAYDNMYPNDQGYGADCVPTVLYYQDGVGVYPYFAVGEWVHLCIIPVTDETIAGLEGKGVEIHEIEE